jgi:hypothetical protein
VAVRERSAGEIADLGYRFVFGLGGWLYVRLFALVALPAWGLCWWAMSSGVDEITVWFLALALAVLVGTPFTVAASRLMFDESPSLRDVLVASGRSFGRSILASTAAATVVLVGCCTVVFAPAALARSLYLGEITLLEGTGVAASFRRSARFMRGRTIDALKVAAMLATMTLVFVGVVEILVTAALEDVLGLDSLRRLEQIFDSPAALLGLFVSVPFVATTRFLAYIDGRTRREAWDVQVRFVKLDLDEQASAA